MKVSLLVLSALSAASGLVACACVVLFLCGMEVVTVFLSIARPGFLTMNICSLVALAFGAVVRRSKATVKRDRSLALAGVILGAVWPVILFLAIIAQFLQCAGLPVYSIF
jgi:hypothetical protein